MLDSACAIRFRQELCAFGRKFEVGKGAGVAQRGEEGILGQEDLVDRYEALTVADERR